MSISIPYDLTLINNNNNFFQISTCKLSSFLCVINDKSIFLRDGSKPNLPVLSFFERTSKCLEAHGSNHWIQWIDSSHISFGTCAGTIFFLKINSKFQLVDKIINNINNIVMSTFSCFHYLGICTTNSTLIFLDTNGKIISKIKMQYGNNTIKQAKFIPPSTLIGLIDGHPVKITLNKDVINLREPISYTFFSFSLVTTLSFSSFNSLFSFSFENGDCFLVSENTPNAAPKYEFKSTINSEIIYNEWIRDRSDLLIIKRNGLSLIYLYNTNSYHELNIPEISNSISIDIDFSNRFLYFLTKDHLYCIDFITINNSFCYTPRKIINLSSNSILHEISDTNLRVELFPIIGYISYGNFQIIWSKSVFVSINPNGNQSRYVKINIHDIVIFKEMIIVFSNSSDTYGYVVAFFDFNAKELAWYPISHAPLFVNNSGDRIVFSSNTKFTVIKPSDNSFNNSIKTIINDNDINYFKFKTYNTSEQIKGITYLSKVKYILYTWDDTLKLYSNERIIEKNVRKFVNSIDFSFIIMQTNDAYSILTEDRFFKFKGTFIFNQSANIYFFNNLINFKELKFLQSTFLPYLLLLYIENEEIFQQKLLIFSKEENFLWSLTQTLILSINKMNYDLFLNLISKNFSNYLFLLFNNIYSKINSENFKLIINFNINFNNNFNNFDELIKLNFLEYLNPLKLIELLSVSNLLLINTSITDFLIELLKKKEFNRFLRISIYFEINLIELLLIIKNFQLNEFYLNFKNDFEIWKEIPNQINLIKFLGSTLISMNLNDYAFICFLIIKDNNKINYLISIDNDIMELQKTFF